jgi:hypothetical protein
MLLSTPLAHATVVAPQRVIFLHALSQMRKYATPMNSVQKEYAFEARISRRIGSLSVLKSSKHFYRLQRLT